MNRNLAEATNLIRIETYVRQYGVESIIPIQPSFMRLFAQVQIGGVSKFAPFGIRISP